MGASYIQLADRIFNGPNSSGNPKTEVFAVLVQAGSEPTYTFDDYSYTYCKLFVNTEIVFYLAEPEQDDGLYVHMKA